MDWVTISALATAGGTLVLAVATFASVRSAGRSARAAERAVQAGLRPLLISSRLDDAVQKVGFADQHWERVPGGAGTAQAADDAVYLTMSLRNAGAGVAVLHGWTAGPLQLSDAQPERPDLATFSRLTRDIYVAAGDVGFWQGALRDPASPAFEQMRRSIAQRRPLTVHLLYGDIEGGQRVVTRFSLNPGQDGQWLASAARHWNVDRPDPR